MSVTPKPTSDEISILFGSDFHFGIPGMNQEEMAQAFAKTIFPQLPGTDIFFINGDFFDRLVIFDNHGFDPIYDIIIDLFALCEQHQVALRILQGTWEHDRKQNRKFGTFYKKGKFTFNFHFAEHIELEEITIRDRTIKVVYVPDDLPFKSSDEIVDVIKNKLVEMNWDHVDYACMHGFFDFTFPKNVDQSRRVVFKEAQFPFVKKIIDVGHVHQYRVSDIAISNGSFDRICHGDEAPKGFIRVLDYPSHYTAHFIENKNAAVFHTLVFTEADDTETMRTRIIAHLTSLHTDRKISLRFVIDTPELIDAAKSYMKDNYPDVNLAIKKSKDIKDKQMLLTPSSIMFTPTEKRIAPTPKTIATFIRAHISEDYVLSTDEIESYLAT